MDSSVEQPLIRALGPDNDKPIAPPQQKLVFGRLEPAKIQKVVRAAFGKFRLCYENALRNCPNLQGRVNVKFVIDTSGSVSYARDNSSDLPDWGVVRCVVREVYKLKFPKPVGGIVIVGYPIAFSPGSW